MSKIIDVTTYHRDHRKVLEVQPYNFDAQAKALFCSAQVEVVFSVTFLEQWSELKRTKHQLRNSTQRVRLALVSNGLRTVADVISCTHWQLSQLPGMGAASLGILEDVIHLSGLALSTKETSSRIEQSHEETLRKASYKLLASLGFD